MFSIVALMLSAFDVIIPLFPIPFSTSISPSFVSIEFELLAKFFAVIFPELSIVPLFIILVEFMVLFSSFVNLAPLTTST